MRKWKLTPFNEFLFVYGPLFVALAWMIVGGLLTLDERMKILQGILIALGGMAPLFLILFKRYG